MNRQEQVRVSISQDREEVARPANNKEEDKAQTRKESTTSFLNPAINLARRLSMKITGQRDPSQIRRRSRRTNQFSPEQPTCISTCAEVNMDMNKRIVVIRKEENMIKRLLYSVVSRLRLVLGCPEGVPGGEDTQVAYTDLLKLPHLEPPQRYRPASLEEMCLATGFTAGELKLLYRGFKTECPTGILTEESFHNIYTSFFPWGEEPYHGSICSYSHYLFSLLDTAGTGAVTFEDFVLTLSMLARGTQEDKIRWMFKLYDLNGDGFISRDEMEDVAQSVFDLLGRSEDEDGNDVDTFMVEQRVLTVHQAMDTNNDGLVSWDEFLGYFKRNHWSPWVGHGIL